MTYTTDWEVDYIRNVFNRNRQAFLNYAEIIMTDKRQWDGEGMDVNVNIIKNEVRRLLQEHQAEKAKYLT